MYAIDTMIYESCLWTLAILKIKNVDYCCIITGISKNEAVSLLQNIDLTEKSET